MAVKRGILYLAGNDLRKLKPGQIKCDILRATKIGMTYSCPAHASVDKRIAKMNTGNAYGLVTKASISCISPRKLERYWHKIYDSKRVRNEWFALEEADLKYIEDTTRLYEETGQGPDCDLFEEIMSQERGAAFSPNNIMETIEAAVEKYMVRDVHIKHAELAKKHVRSYLDKEEAQILIQALRGHPKSIKKIGVGIQHFFVARAKDLYSYCFHVERVDGSEEDFSYLACFGKSLKRGKGRKGYTHVRKPSRNY